MLIQEFTEMTGFEPTMEEYKEIELMYLNFDGSKQAFCKDFVERGEPARRYKKRAECIEALRMKLAKMEKDHEAGMVKLMARVAQLQEELDRELEWKPADGVGTHMSQEGYVYLVRHGNKLGLEDTIKLIATEFGFAPDRIEIKDEAVTYEVNKYGRLRVKDELERPPVYSSTEWNYIRFDCAGYMYEMVNGELMRYAE